MKVHGYIRVSTEEQADSRLGLEAQRHAIERAVSLRGWELLCVHEDAGLSGKGMKRPALASALSLIQPGEALMVSKLDRLSRSVHDASGLMEEAVSAGWALVSLDPDLGTPWDNVERYWDQSPLKYVAKVTAPVLIIHSENDYRCPMEQAEQWFIALKRLGRTVEFVRFSNESHGLSRNGAPKHRVERLERTLGWFERYL